MSSDSENQPQARQFRGPVRPAHPVPGPFEMWRLSAGDAVAEVAPSRGGLVTRFAVGDEEVLYLDIATMLDRKKNVRGGVPVLFPIAGRLTGDRYEVNGQSYPMRQHGLARHVKWAVIDVAAAHLTMEFRSDTATRTSFPFDFSYRLTVDVGRAGFRSMVLESEIENRSPLPMPLHTGLHPYFFVAERDKANCFIEVAAGTAYDNIRGDTQPWSGLADFTATELDLHLSDLIEPRANLHIVGKPIRRLSWNGIYSNIVLWTVSLKDFVCVEPWSGPGDAFNSGRGLLSIPPGESMRGQFIVEV